MPLDKDDALPARTLLRWTPTLLFHEVLPDGTDPLPSYAITRSTLKAILADFVSRGYAPGTLADALGEGQAGGKRLVLTFDDGTSDFLENALPVLDEFDFKATLFIVSGLMGSTRNWKTSSGAEAMDPVPLMSAGEILSLHRAGFTIGSHTVSHRALPALSPDEARKELIDSRRALEELTGSQVEWFAYPYVALDESTRAHVRKPDIRARAAATTPLTAAITSTA